MDTVHLGLYWTLQILQHYLLSLCFQSYESRLSAGKILIEVEENEVSAKELRTVVIFLFFQNLTFKNEMKKRALISCIHFC